MPQGLWSLLVRWERRMVKMGGGGKNGAACALERLPSLGLTPSHSLPERPLPPSPTGLWAPVLVPGTLAGSSLSVPSSPRKGLPQQQRRREGRN